MRLGVARNLLLLLIVVGNLALWAVPSNVVLLIARDHDTFLGRYSREHLAWILASLALSVCVGYLVLSRSAAVLKRRAFHLTAGALGVIPATCAMDLLARRCVPDSYVRDSLAYHRPANANVRSTIIDRPDAARTYPVVPPGFPPYDCTLHTDARGFRNASDLKQYDIVALGDSFTEGSRVSDAQAWPVRFAQLSGRSVCNLGMSGYAPQHYLAALREVGFPLKPRGVICTLYEENDFRAANMVQRPDSEFDRFIKQSPLRRLLDGFFVRTLGSINAHGRIEGIEVLSWLPMAVPAGPDAKYYAFAPNVLLDLYVTPGALRNDRHWEAVTGMVRQMQMLCREAGAEFVLVYLPSKPHVVLPLARDRLELERVRAFAALRSKDPLPPARQFADELFARLDTKETALAEWCRSEGIAFVSMTPALRAAAAAGRQVFFTYNDHWTPVGHEVVAAALHDYWKSRAGPATIHPGATKTQPGGP